MLELKGYPIMATWSKCKKKPWLILEVLIALALLSLCLLPFIPKNAQKLQHLKNQAAYLLLAHDFEHRQCELREKAVYEGPEWIKKAKEGEVIFKDKRDLYFEDLRLHVKSTERVSVLKIYDTKEGQKKLYRFKAETLYSSPHLKKKYPFYFYLTLED
jgi:hypothetical protein